jgi:hypothetical protein
MSLDLTAAAIAILRDAYPRQPFPDASVAFYARKLADLDAVELAGAVDRITNRSTFLPSVAEIRSEVAEARLGLPTTAEAWETAESGSLRTAPEPLRRAVEIVGGRWAIRHSDNPTAVRAQFRQAYEDLRQEAVLREAGALPERRDLRAIEASPDPALAEAEHFVPGPVMARAGRELTGQPLESPTDEEKRDAIRILKRGPISADDPLYKAAELVLVHADQAKKEE